MKSITDRTWLKDNSSNVVIWKLDDEVDNSDLYEQFSKVGDVVCCKVSMTMNKNSDNSVSCKSNHYGFARFATEEEAESAIEKMNGLKINDNEIVVERYDTNKDQRKSNAFNNLYVKEFPLSWSDDDLKSHFEKHGPLGSVSIMWDDNGTSKGFGFVCYEKPEDATKALENEHGKVVDDKTLYVSKAEKKAHR